MTMPGQFSVTINTLSPERAKVATFYVARSEIITPLPWLTFALPFSIRVSQIQD
jgi:hypothetical protein